VGEPSGQRARDGFDAALGGDGADAAQRGAPGRPRYEQDDEASRDRLGRAEPAEAEREAQRGPVYRSGRAATFDTRTA